MKATLFFVISVLGLIGISVLLTIYTAWAVYPLEIKWLHLTQVVIFSDKEIMTNFNSLMHYLTNPFHLKLSMPNFPSSESGRYHFEAVKKLFHLAQVVSLLALPVTILSFRKKSSFSTKLFSKGYLVMALVPIGVVLLASGMGFSTFFILFHKLLFPGDSTWLFDPVVDPVIKILPETYFLHCFILFAIFYESLFLAAYFKTRKHR